MLIKIFGIVLILNTYIKHSSSSSIADLNVTNAILLISSQLTELRSELVQQRNLLDGLTVTENTRGLKFYGRNCAEATGGFKISGIYEILIPSYSNQPFKVVCDAETQGGGWTIILSRMDGSVDFYRNWNNYEKGFGDLDGEFFLGLNKIHALTSEFSQELLVVLEDFEGLEKYEKYEKFAIGDSADHYALYTLGNASGTAGDSLSFHHTMKFSTFDRDNDNDTRNCAETFTGAWWYNNCQHSNLAGKYKDNKLGKGVNWKTFRGDEYSLKRAVMMIRPRR